MQFYNLNENVGHCKLILGPMMSGKTTTMLTELTKLNDDFKILFVSCSIDNRLDIENSLGYNITTHNELINKVPKGVKFISIDPDSLNDLEKIEPLHDYDFLFIDESQFFLNLNELVRRYVNLYQLYVIVSGLSGDYKMEKFGEVLDLIPFCDMGIEILSSVCRYCLENGTYTTANFTKRLNLTETNNVIDVGGASKYVPTCRKHY